MVRLRGNRISVASRLLVVSIVLVGLSAGSVGAAGGSSGLLQADTDPPPHQHPDEIDDDDDSQLEPALESSLSDRLRAATEAVDERQYTAADEPVGEEYDEQLTRYETVVGQTQAEPYQEARDHHRTFTDSNQRFDELRAEYEQAQQDGDEQETREVIRELETEAERLQQSGDELIDAYAAIDDTTEADHDSEIALIEARQQEVETFLDELTDTELVETQLAVTATDTESSFDDPIELEGQLTTADGEPLADESITVGIETQEYDVETDNDGTFSLSHRPVQLAVGETTLTVEYLPDSASVYQSTAETVAVSIVQTDATVEIDSHSSTASFEENATAEGRVVAGEDAQPVAGTPLGVFVGDEQLGTVTTDENGAFAVASTVPGSVEAGDSTLEVRTVGTDRAVGPATASEPITIDSTPTTLEIRSESAGDGSVTVVGSLETEDGTPVDAATVGFAANGETLGTAETTQNGTFEQQLSMDASAGETHTIEASFDGEASNLDTATATTTVSGPQQAEPSLVPFSSRLLLVASSGAVLLFGGVAFWWVRRRDPPTAESALSVGDVERSGRELSDDLRSAAAARREAGEYETATLLAYAAVRTRFAHEYDLPDGATHWELYATYAATDLDQAAALEQLVQQYEAVCFAAETADDTTAEVALSAAEQLVAEIDPDAMDPEDRDTTGESGSTAAQ